jgi:hypothetical protein
MDRRWLDVISSGRAHGSDLLQQIAPPGVVTSCKVNPCTGADLSTFPTLFLFPAIFFLHDKLLGCNQEEGTCVLLLLGAFKAVIVCDCLGNGGREGCVFVRRQDHVRQLCDHDLDLELQHPPGVLCRLMPHGSTHTAGSLHVVQGNPVFFHGNPSER